MFRFPYRQTALAVLGALCLTACGSRITHSDRAVSGSTAASQALSLAQVCYPACHAPSTCRDGQCVTLQPVEISVDNANVRACQALFSDPNQYINGVVATDAALVEWVREGSFVAVAFTNTADSPLPDGALQLMLNSQASLAPAPLKTRCYNRHGLAVAANLRSLGGN